MADTLYLLAITGRDLALLLGVVVGCWLLGLLIFWLFYGGCALAAGLSMRIGYTFGLIVFLILIFFVLRDLREYFVWWQFTPGPTAAVMNSAILVLALSVLWLVLIWAIWPRPRRQPGVL